MRAIDYDKAYDSMMEVYLKHGERVEIEQKYLNALYAQGFPKESALASEHESIKQQYLSRGSGVWEALAILSRLSSGHDVPQEYYDAKMYKALKQLVERYIANLGTQHEFVSCITPKGIPSYWQDAKDILAEIDNASQE